MSMNLWCKEFGQLVQTPTHITYMCYYADLKKRTPSPWETIRDKYISWLGAETNQSQDWMWYDEHVKKLRSYKKLSFAIV